MPFTDLFTIEPSEETQQRSTPPKKRAVAPPKKSKFPMDERGCKFCPMNKIHGITKIKGEIKGRKILVVAQSPGPEENDQGKELVGPSGQLFWKEMRSVGLSRKDCDIQNVMRCLPSDRVEGSYSEYLKMRSPSKQELHCCSVFTDEAMAQVQATQIIILGQVAAKQLLNLRTMPEQKAFWHEPFKAKVYILDHPSFFVRGYGEGPRMEMFRTTLKRVVEERDNIAGADLSDPFAYVKSQDYRLVVTGKQAAEAAAVVRSFAAKGKRVSVDIEADVFPPNTEQEVFACGLCPKPGLVFVFVFKHRDVSPKHGAAVLAVLRELLEDPSIEKVLHYGCSDVASLESL